MEGVWCGKADERIEAVMRVGNAAVSIEALREDAYRYIDLVKTCRRHHCPKDALEYFPCPGRKMCTPCEEMRSAMYQPCDRKGGILLQIELVGVNVPLYSKF